jgi:Ca2+-binding RTX toxin-like protein
MRRAALVLAAMALALLLASGVALAVNKIGTNGPDTLMGTDGNDNLIGRGGNDRLFALNGRDNLLGGPGKDWVDTHPKEFRSGDKNLQGGPGNDIVVGGTGSDNVLDDAGNDFLIDDNDPESSLDKLSGGDGNDVFSVENAQATKDIVACGSGFDRVLADRNDVLAPDCERVRIVHGSVAEVEEQSRAFFGSVPQSFYDGLQPGVLQPKVF